MDSSFFQPYPTGKIKTMQGDSAHWKLVNYKDHHWSSKLPDDATIYWWRMEIELDSTLLQSKPIGIQIRSFLGSYEAFWDGNFIGSNGTFGYSKEEEIPGEIDKLFLLPEMLIQPGKHLLAVRVSQFHALTHRTYPFLKLGNYDRQSQTLLMLAVFMHILVGIFLIIAIYYFLLFVKNNRQYTFLIFGGLSLFLFAWIALEFLKFYYAYPYWFHFLRLDIISTLAFCLTWGTTAFFVHRFKIPFGKWILALQFIIQLIILQFESDYDLCIYYEVNLSVLFSLIIILWANYHQKPYAWESLISLMPLVSTFFFFYPIYYDQTLFIAYTFFILANLYVLSKSIGIMREQLESSRQQANLLKIELLKKNIQPHYLMNTLTSLISWVEESPKVAVRFIEALANEFEVLGTIAEKKQITIKEELDLCRSHLKVMRFRNEINYKLETTDIPEDEIIPPAVFLTLLENGLTHNQIQEQEADFKIHFQQKNSTKIYTFFAPGIPIQKVEDSTAGTGWTYIRARLQESFGDRWKMTSNAVNNGWETKIYIEQ